jgi:UbiD family decarboxylase
MALQSYIQFTPASYIVVVGPDIDPHDTTDVMWAMAMQADPVLDSVVVTYGLSGAVNILGKRHDPQRPTTTGGQVIIDATKPVPERFDTFQPRCEPPDWERAEIKRMKEKLGG